MVGTGQTTLIQGGKYGVALDALVPQFCSGEVEDQVVAAFEGEDPDVIIVEGQGALSHPAYLTSAHILRGSRPAGVIVQHAPKRDGARRLPDGRRCPRRPARSRLIEAFADTKVIGITINHEHMTDDEIDAGDRRATSSSSACPPPTRSPARSTGWSTWCCSRSPRSTRAASPTATVSAPAARDRPRRDRSTTPAPSSTGSAPAASGSPASPRPALGVARAWPRDAPRAASVGLGDSRVENLGRLRAARRPDAAHADPLARC